VAPEGVEILNDPTQVIARVLPPRLRLEDDEEGAAPEGEAAQEGEGAAEEEEAPAQEEA
jgi:hypothetical protein